MEKTIAVLPGDGIGPEVMQQALRVLEAINVKYNHQIHVKHALIGGAAYVEHEQHFPEATKATCQQSDAILFGSIGGPIDQAHLPQWKDCERNSLLSLRKAFQFSANYRPAKIYKELKDICPLRDHIIGDGLDILIIRELIGGIYFGEHKQFSKDNERQATDMAEYSESQIATVAHHAFQAAQKRGGKLTSVDKANVLATSKLWREVVSEIAKQYLDVTLEHMLVDNCAMQLFINPGQFDVIVTGNLFGDILSDAASAIPGSLGLMPSASLNKEGFGMYEPSGGSAPNIAGKDIANPIAQILSLAMLLQFSFNLQQEATAIEAAVNKALAAGYRTKDIHVGDTKLVGTKELTDKILSYL